MATGPSYHGRGLVNLVAEVEFRLTGQASAPRLEDPGLVPEADTYVLVLFDGLGVAQLEHPSADVFRSASRATLDAPFPTTTSVSLATIATGLAPSRHGLVAHLAWMEEMGRVVNTLKWVDLAGDHVEYPYWDLLPSPNLWERLRGAGVEPITVQPGAFTGSPLSQAVYRGARFEGVWDTAEMVEATLQLAKPGRMLFTYFPQVDFAGHVFGLESEEFTVAMGEAVRVWNGIANHLPSRVALLGTADHGLAAFPDHNKHLVRGPAYSEIRFAGDTRGVQMWGDLEVMDHLAVETGGELADPADLVGPEPGTAALSRLGERVLLPPDHLAVIPKGFDKRLACYHGGLSRAEVEIPLLVG